MNKKEKALKKTVKKTNKTNVLKQLQEKCNEFEGKYQRALADYQNLVKRQIKEKEGLAKYSNEQLIQEMIPVFDNLKMALRHVDEKDKDNEWIKGVEYVVKQFREVLNTNKVEEIEIGKKFDPNTMEAIKGSGEKIEKEAKSGYIMDGKVIIPSKVILEEEEEEDN